MNHLCAYNLIPTHWNLPVCITILVHHMAVSVSVTQSHLFLLCVCVCVCVCACMPECVCVWAACVVCLCASFIIKKSLVWSVGPNDCDLLKLHLHCEPSQLSKNRRTQNFKLKGFPVSPRMLRALHTTASDVHILGHLIWVRLQQLREQSYPFLPACAAFSCAWTLV